MAKITSEEFQEMIKKAYKGRNRDVVEASSMLQIEASELSELYLKKKWYNKQFKKQDILSEAGDILNFLTFVLQFEGLTLEQAMQANKQKLIMREWLTLDDF